MRLFDPKQWERTPTGAFVLRDPPEAFRIVVRKLETGQYTVTRFWLAGPNPSVPVCELTGSQWFCLTKAHDWARIARA